MSCATVKVVQLALAERTGLSGFTYDRGGAQNRLAPLGESPLVVPTVALDEVVHRYGFPPPNLMKLDVEGCESLVLEGARGTLERYQPVVFVALHGLEQAEASLHLLERLGYEARSLDGCRIGEADEVDEIYAVPKR